MPKSSIISPVADALRAGAFNRADDIDFTDIIGDPIAWCKVAEPKIESKRYGIVSFEPYDYQIAVMRAVANAESMVIPKSRQVGISTAIMVAFVHQLLFKAEHCGTPLHCHVVANKEEVAIGRLLRIAKFALATAKLTEGQRRNLRGTDWHTMVPQISYDTKLAHNYIRAHTSGSDPGRSFGGNAALLEEVAAMPNAYDVWKSLAPMLDDVPHSVVMLVSTYQGDGDFFCDCVDNAEEMGMTCLPIDWNAHPDRDEKWLKNSQARFHGRISEWEEEFALKRIHAGNKLVDMEKIRKAAEGVTYYGDKNDSSHPIPIESHRYSKGVDCAGPGQDLTVFTAIDLTVRPPQIVYQKALPYLSTEDRIATIEDFDMQFRGQLFIDGTNDKALPALVKSRNKIAVHITAGMQVRERIDRVEGLKWRTAPRSELQSWLTANLERGKLIAHLEHFPDLFTALDTAQVLEGAKRRGKKVDYLDSLMMANMSLMTGRDREGSGETIVSIPTSKHLTDIRGRRW